MTKDESDNVMVAHRATVKWYSPEKGYGVVTLTDGIAVLHASVLRQVGMIDIKAGAELVVAVSQGLNGRMVSWVLPDDWDDDSKWVDGWGEPGDDTF